MPQFNCTELPAPLPPDLSKLTVRLAHAINAVNERIQVLGNQAAPYPWISTLVVGLSHMEFNEFLSPLFQDAGWSAKATYSASSSAIDVSLFPLPPAEAGPDEVV